MQVNHDATKHPLQHPYDGHFTSCPDMVNITFQCDESQDINSTTPVHLPSTSPSEPENQPTWSHIFACTLSLS